MSNIEAKQRNNIRGSIRTIAQMQSVWREEMHSALLYDALAAQESDHRMAYMLKRLSQNSSEEAGFWSKQLQLQDAQPPASVPLRLRAKLAIWLAGHFGVRPVRGILSALKVRGMSAYAAPDLRGHIAIDDVKQLNNSSSGGGNLRAAVFGVNDGLVSNTSLILGLLGASAEPRTLLLAGLAGMLAGALSMASGEYLSVRAQREVYEYQLELERAELEEYPDAERQELAVIYEAKGLTPADADRIARALIADPQLALDTMAREELGLNPDELGSPTGAASASFVAFGMGALVPVLPFFFLSGNAAVVVAVTLACVSLFSVGAALSLFTGRSSWLSGLRMLCIGAGAGIVTYLIGSALNLSALI